MGVPAFFRWLQRRFPLIITNCIEEDIENGNDYSNPNPNTIGDVDFDCLYLDMNGIIHPCFHAHDSNEALTEEQIFENIDNYINRLFNIVRPRKLLFLAIDGVAPRAKMNQQRARRYRSAKDAVYNHELKIAECKKANQLEELQILEDPDYLSKHDTNVITPGTRFMKNLAKHLQVFIKNQQETIPAWSDISIILSDASVPGEGEHKIMDFIRGQRFEQGYDPNRHHCIYGLDSDLIFLGLASHEPYFTILREKVLENVDGFQFVSLWVLRQFLAKELKPSVSLPFDWDFENVIDDLVMLCFSIGNDFLPGIPGFSIQAGIINALMIEYTHNLPKMGGYIVSGGIPNFARLCSVLSKLSKYEGKALDSILHLSSHSISAQEFVNEICDTDNLVLNEMKHRGFNQGGERIEQPENLPNIEELKSKYYEFKFGVNYHKETIIKEYLTGMYWTLMYYTHGCASWSWFYPYHYPPCISDFASFENFEVNFELSEPFKPLIQLMAVLPPQSAQWLPPKLQELMLNDDSPLKSFYPTRFTVDLFGGTTLWKGFVIIPFIDADLLMSAINQCDDLQLTSEEKHRNSTSKTHVYPGKNEEIVQNEAFGPQFWGTLTEARNHGYYLDFKKISPTQITSFVLLNIKMPPSIINFNGKDPFMRGITKRAPNASHSLKGGFSTNQEIPLQIPGYPPGTTSDYRIRALQNSHKTSNKNPNRKVKSSAFSF